MHKNVTEIEKAAEIEENFHILKNTVVTKIGQEFEKRVKDFECREHRNILPVGNWDCYGEERVMYQFQMLLNL